MATNQLSDIKKKFTEEFLKCEVCFDENISTRRLPCRHNFCLSCLERIADGEDEFSCPKCRANVDVPEGGFDQFPEDVPTKKMLDFAKILHKSASFFCEHHPNKPLDLYCKTDNTLICGTCVVKQHKGHDAETIEDAAQERKGCFQRMTDAQDQKLHNIQKENSKSQKTKKKVKTETKHQVANVTRKAEMLKAAIERRCNVLCSVIKNIHSRDLYELEQEQEMLKEQEDEVKTKKQRYVNVLEQPTDVEMMLCADSVQDLEPSDIEVPISTKDVIKIALPETDVETLVEKLFGQLEIKKKLTEKLKTVRTFKTLHGKDNNIKKIVASCNKIYVLSKGKVEVFSEQDGSATVINGFHNPADIAVLPNGDILAIDNGRVKVFDYLEDEVNTGDLNTMLYGPCRIAVDGRGLVYVSQWGSGLKVYDFSILCSAILLQDSTFELPHSDNIYINQSNDNIYSFSSEELVVLRPNGNQLHKSKVCNLAENGWSIIRGVAADIYGNTLVRVKDELLILDNNMKAKHAFELPCEGDHIAVSSNGYLVHGTKDGQIVLYQYAD